MFKKHPIKHVKVQFDDCKRILPNIHCDSDENILSDVGQDNDGTCSGQVAL